MTAVAVLICHAVGYGLGTLVAIPYRPATSETKVNRDGVTRVNVGRLVEKSEYAESDAIRLRVMWFCGLAGLLAAQSVFVVVHLRPAPGESR